jgi:hypothetical protein
MLANSYVLNGEARDRFERILDRLDTEFEPETQSGQALVDMMAATIAAQIAQKEISQQDAQLATNSSAARIALNWR